MVTLGLVLIGVGFTLGNSLGGRLADWSLDGAARIFLAALAVIMLLAGLLLVWLGGRSKATGKTAADMT